MRFEIMEIVAGMQDRFVLLRNENGLVVRLYRIMTSSRKCSAQMCEVKSPEREKILKDAINNKTV